MKFTAAFTAALASAAVASAIPSSDNTKRSDSRTYKIANSYYQQNPKEFCSIWNSVCSVIDIALTYDSSVGPVCSYSTHTREVTASCLYVDDNGKTVDVTTSVGALFIGTDLLASA